MHAKQHKHVDDSRGVVLCIRQRQLFYEEIPMYELLTAAAVRAVCYLEGLNGRGVAPDPTIVVREGMDQTLKVPYGGKS